MNEPATLKSLRDRPFELLAELERRGRAVTAAASENPGAREWVGVAFRMAGELYSRRAKKRAKCSRCLA